MVTEGTFASTFTQQEAAPQAEPQVETTDGGAEPFVEVKDEPTKGDTSPFGDFQGWADTKGFKSVAEAIAYAESLDRKFEKGEQAFLPGSPEEEAALYTKLGKPVSPKDYDFGLPENGDRSLADALAPTMHELNLTTKQAKGLSERYNALQQEQAAKAEQDFLTKANAEISEMKRTLGKEYDRLVYDARISAQTFGVDPEKFEALEREHKGFRHLQVNWDADA